VGEVLDVAIKIFFGNAATLFKVVAVVVVPVQLLLVPVFTSAVPSGPVAQGGPVFDAADIAANLGATLVGGFIGFVAGTLATAACFKAVSDAYLGERPEWRESLGFAWKRVLAVLFVTLLGGLLALLAAIPFILPAIWLGVSWLLASPAVLSEDVRGFGALGRSFRLVRGRWWPTFGAIALAYILVAVIQGVVLAIATGLLLTDLDPGGFAVTLVTQILTAIATVLTTPFLAAVTVVIYYDLRVRKEGFDLALLAERVGAAPRASHHSAPEATDDRERPAGTPEHRGASGPERPPGAPEDRGAPSEPERPAGDMPGEPTTR